MQKVEIELVNGRRVTGKVVWQLLGLCVVQFSEPLSVHEQSSEVIDEGSLSLPPKVERRDNERWPCDWPAKYSVDAKTFTDIRIINTSAGGFGLSASVSAEVDDEIIIIFENIGSFICRLAWKDDERCGVQILDDPDAMTSSQIEALVDAIAAGN